MSRCHPVCRASVGSEGHLTLRPRGIACSLLFAALAQAFAASPAHPLSITDIGTDGAWGANGLPGQPGGDGGDGEDSEVAAVTRDAVGLVQATGGRGGSGGDGGAAPTPGAPAGPAGSGGDGGDAGARLESEANGIQATSIARGGDGGGGSRGGSGGDAIAAAAISTEVVGTGSVLLTARATGGRPGGNATGARAGEATAHGRVESSGAPVGALVNAIGGDSTFGGSTGGDATVDAEVTTHGDGHHIVLGTVFSLLFGGALGGEGGDSPSSEEASQLGGNATSRSIAAALGNSEVRVFDVAQGGRGGRQGWGAGGGPGGSASSYASGTNAGSALLQVESHATGGAGGEGAKRGAGGAASAAAQGVSLGGANVLVRAVQTAGNRSTYGWEQSGSGTDSIMWNAVSGSTTGTLTLEQIANGGACFGCVSGGRAESWLEAENPAGGDLSVLARANSDFSPAGAHAAATGTSTGSARVTVKAEARAGGVATLGPVSGVSERGVVEVIGIARSGTGSGGLEGDAPTTLVENAVDGRTTGPLRLTQEVSGRRGGVSAAGVTSRGGDAISLLERAVSAGDLVLASGATGGTGGASSGFTEPALMSAADGGTGSASGTATNSTGKTTVRVLATGGTGGNGVQGLAAGDGGDAIAAAIGTTERDGDEVVVGAQLGQAEIGARGGTGGHSETTEWEGVAGAGGRGGDAHSSSTGIGLGNNRVRVFDRARGGTGGGVQFTTGLVGGGGDGGDAVSEATGRNGGAEPVFVDAYAVGGEAGLGRGLPSGRPGSASASAYGRSDGGGDVFATATQFAGNRSGVPPGRAGDSSMVDAVGGSTDGTLHLRQISRGGSATNAFNAEDRGGDASSVLHALNQGDGDLVAISEAQGGEGGSPFGSAGGECDGFDHRPERVRALDRHPRSCDRRRRRRRPR